MPADGKKTVEEYLRELRQTKGGKPPQIKEALDTYLELWDAAIENGVADLGEDIETALSKIDKRGGLYEAAQKAAGDQEKKQS